MQATLLLIRQHRRIRNLLNAMELCAPMRRGLLPELVEELLNHLTLEDHVFYSQAQRAAGTSIKPARDAHRDTRRALLRVAELPSHGDVFVASLRELRATFDRHVANDERLFAIVARTLQPGELSELGEDMAAFAAALVRTSRAPSRGPATHVTAA